ncbi:MAG: TAXI family TRAP transporter solute-binding subunit [Candidatus Electrothrix sp. Rat3]|nr:TAXI family TRAP transporter solute-binding subunit [Candidatus Electrothrix rattekaaiensis]
MEQKKILISLAVLFIIVGSIGTWFCTRDTLPDAIRIASGSIGGEYYKFGDALEKKLRSRTSRPVKHIETTGTMENLRLLKEGVVEVALLQSIVFPDLDNKASSNNISVIAPLFLEPVVILAHKGSGIESVYDMENRRVCIGPEESGTKKTSEDLLKFYELNNKVTKVPEFFYDNSSHSHNDRNSCDAGIMVMGLSGPCFKEIGKITVQVIELPYARALAGSKAFLAEFTLPEGVFARHSLPVLPHKNIQTVAYTALLAVRKDASSALVNEVLDAIYRTDLRINFSDLLPLKDAREWSEIPLNQTAQDYYNSMSQFFYLDTFSPSLFQIKVT